MLSHPAVLSFGVCTVLLAIFGWLINTDSAMDTINPSNQIRIKAALVGGSIPLILIVLVFGMGVFTKQQNNRQVKNEYTQVIKEKLKSVGTTGEIKVIKFSKVQKNTANVDFTVQQEDVVVYGKAVLKKYNRDWKMEKSTITTYQNSLEAFLQIPTQTKEANVLMEIYKAQVIKSIEKNNLENKLSMPKENKNNKDEKTISGYYYLSGANSEVIQSLAKKNSESETIKTSIFGGYSALTIPQLMENHLIMMSIPLDTLDKEAYRDWEKLSEDYKTIIKGLNFTRLSDGYYSIASINFEVKNHQFEQFLEPMSHRSLSNPEEKLGVFFLVNYAEWS